MKFALYLSLVCLWLCPPAQAIDPARDAEEMAVYTALFRGFDTVVIPKPKPDEEGPIPLLADDPVIIRTKLPGVEDATIEDLRRHASDRQVLDERSVVGAKVTFIDGKTFAEVFRREDKSILIGKARFQGLFPSAILARVSHVGFNPGRTQALVLIVENPNIIDMRGVVVFFEKVDGKWQRRAQMVDFE